MLAHRVAFAAVLSLAAAGFAQQPPAPSQAPTQGSQPSMDDGKNPAVKRDVSHYNLDKSGLGIQGYDPVSYFPEGGGKPAKGKKELGYSYRGVTYRFTTQADLDRFKTDPRKYEPAHGGWCSSAMADGGRKVEIDPKAYKLTNGRVFLFYTDIISDARSFWNKDEPRNTRDADANWKKLSGEDPRKPVESAPAAPKKGG